MIRINNIKLSVKDFTEKRLDKKICDLLRKSSVPDYKVVKKSIDCRDISNVVYVFAVELSLANEKEEARLVQKVHNNNIMLTKPVNYCFPYTNKEDLKKEERPVIIGAGPCGYFAALYLARNGYRPILFERGQKVEDRNTAISTFFETGKLNKESNVCYGEGGAGAFSDGKLNTGNKDKFGYIKAVLKDFYMAGANESVIYDAKPHIGTDKLTGILKNIREEIISLGGEINFDSCLTEIKRLDNDDLIEKPSYELTINHNGEIKKHITRLLVLAIGHSAHDTYKMLYDFGLTMEQKPFAMGLRIEHKREDIDKARYGEFARYLPAADYKLTYHATNGRSVFSFCMCPGGYVVNSSSEEGCLNVNGMSYSKRDGKNSNSAIVVSILPEDYSDDNPLSGLDFQRNIERSFYNMCDGAIPVQTFIDFKNNKKSETLLDVIPCIKGKYALSNINDSLPEYLSHAIIEAVDAFGRQIKGFNKDGAVLSGVEARTSSPVKIVRDESMFAFPGIIPCGEGAGYAGGITSAAVDGIKAAEACAKYINNN